MARFLRTALLEDAGNLHKLAAWAEQRLAPDRADSRGIAAVKAAAATGERALPSTARRANRHPRSFADPPVP